MVISKMLTLSETDRNTTEKSTEESIEESSGAEQIEACGNLVKASRNSSKLKPITDHSSSRQFSVSI